LNSDQIAWKDRAKDALPVRKKRKFFQAFYKRKRYLPHYFWYALSINERILYFLWNLTDRTVLIPTLIKCDLAKRIVSWISQAAMLRKKSRRPLISIAHNISRHDDGADELNKYDAIRIIKQYQHL